MTFKRELKESFIRWANFPRTKIPFWTLKKLKNYKMHTVGSKGSWADFLMYITRDMSLSPTLHERVSEGSFANLMSMWAQNYAENLPFIRNGNGVQVVLPENPKQQTYAQLTVRPPVLEIEKEFSTLDVPFEVQKTVKVKYPPSGSAVVVGRGPSLFEHGHLQTLAEARQKGDYTGIVVASDGGLIPCLEAGVIPEAVVTVDGAPIIKKWFEHPLVKQYGHRIKWVTTVTVNHEVFLAAHAAGLDIYWFNPMFDDWRQNESWTKIQKLMSTTIFAPNGVPNANAGGNAGAFAWITAMAIFKRSPVALIGIDFGYPEGTPLEQTHYFNQMLKEAKGDVSIIRQSYKQFYHPTFKTRAYVDLVFYHYRQAFLEMQMETQLWYRLYDGTINCTEGGTLFGHLITCMPFDQFLKEHKK